MLRATTVVRRIRAECHLPTVRGARQCASAAATGGPPGGRGVALLGVCDDRGSSFRRGSAAAPKVLREELFSDRGNSFSERAVDIDQRSWHDSGDVVEAPDEEVASRVSTLVADGYVPLVLGGDHAISRPVLAGMRCALKGEDEERPLVVLQFDAHPDLYDELECVGDGGAYPPHLSHASQFTRVLEAGHCDLLIQLGVRTATDTQRANAQKHNVHMLEMAQISHQSLGGHELARLVCEIVSDHFGVQGAQDAALYISFDLDALDPAFMGAVSHPEPGGLSIRQAVDCLHALRGRAGELRGADVVEYNPQLEPLTHAEAAGGPPQRLGAATAVKIMKELAKVMQASYGPPPQ